MFLSAHSHSRPVGLSPAIRMSFIIINMPQDYKSYFRLFVRKTASMHTRRETPFRGRTCRTGPGSGATQRGNMELQAGYPAQNCLAGSRPPVAYICGSCHFLQKTAENAFCHIESICLENSISSHVRTPEHAPHARRNHQRRGRTCIENLSGRKRPDEPIFRACLFMPFSPGPFDRYAVRNAACNCQIC